MTEVQKRLREESDTKDKLSDKLKPTKKEKFPYTKDEYENRIVFSTFLKYFTSKTLFTVFVKNYFKDKTVTSCAVEIESKETIRQNKEWLMLYKLNYAYAENDIVYVSVIRKYNCTADKFYDKLKKRKDEWEDCEEE